MSHHGFGVPAWIVVAVIIVLITAHAAAFAYLSRVPMSVTAAAGIVAVIAAKYLWWRHRMSRPRNRS